MLPGFGFSVGDFISAIGLIKKVSDALKDAGGASFEYQNVIIELEGLERALKVVAALEPTQNNANHVNAIRGMALSCQMPLRKFLESIQRYETSLGALASRNYLQGAARKAKWAVQISDQVRALRAVVAAKVVSINLLLNMQLSEDITRIEPAIREESNHLHSEISKVKQILSDVRLDVQRAEHQASESSYSTLKAEKSTAEAFASLDHKVEDVVNGTRSVEMSVVSLKDATQQMLEFLHRFPREIRELLQKILRTNLQMYYMLRHLQNNLASSPTTLLESNIHFEDALGRMRQLPYEFFCHWEPFEGLLKAEFRGAPGEAKVLEGSYHLFDSENHSQLILKDDWAYKLKPGSKVSMSMILKQIRRRSGTCPRPSCSRKNTNIISADSVTTCSYCGLIYHISDATPRAIGASGEEESIILKQQAEEDVRVFGQRPVPFDAGDANVAEFDVSNSNLNETSLSILKTGKVLQTSSSAIADEEATSEPEYFFPSGRLAPVAEEKIPQTSPLAAWLSQTMSVFDEDEAASSKETGNLSDMDPEDIEAREIEAFRNIHISSDDQIDLEAPIFPNQSSIGQTSGINLGARIFHRNIRDMYPDLPQYLAERLANANALRSQRLESLRIENESDCEASSLSSWAKDSLGCEIGPGENARLQKIAKMPQTGASPFKVAPKLPIRSATDLSYWSGLLRRRGPHSSASGSSVTNDSLHGSAEGHRSQARSFSTGKSSGSRLINNPRESLLTLPPPPVELGTQQSFSCDICWRTVEVLRKRDWRKHVFQDLEPYMCTFEDCPIADKTYSTSRAFITHEMRHHRDVSRVFACDHCNERFDRKRDAKKHLHFDQCGGRFHSSRRIASSGGKMKSGFSVVEERVADSVCPFCTKPITGGRGYLTQHLGRHLEEISFAVVRKPYGEWQFYEDSASATSPAPSIVLNRNIHQAAAEGSVRLGIDVLTAGADVDAEIDGKTPLYIASAAGHYALVWLLLRKGADPQKKSVRVDGLFPNWTPLEAASKAGHVEVAALLAKIAFDQGLLSMNQNALQLAAHAGHSEIVKELVRIFGTVGEGCHPTPLYCAAKHGHIDIVKFLLLNGAKGTPTTGRRAEPKEEPWSFCADSCDKAVIADPLLASLEGACRDITLLLLDSGACISQLAWEKAADDLELVRAMLANSTKLKFDSQSALMSAIQAGNAEIIAKLMENGNVAPPQAVYQACRFGYVSVLEIFLQQGACPDMLDLGAAIKNGHADIVKALALLCPKLLEDLVKQLKPPAHIVGTSMVTKALESGSRKMVELLLEYGGALPLTSPLTGRVGCYGRDNALHHAANAGHCDIVRLLLAKGFDPNVEGYYRENPLRRACDSGHEEVVRLLLEAGANAKGTNGATLRSPMGYASNRGRADIINILKRGLSSKLSLPERK